MKYLKAIYIQKEQPGTRPEIYVQGNRNPYRISVDQKNSFLYWGEVGPDANNDSLDTRGPRGYDEVNQARKAGYFGWPLFVGNNYPYQAVRLWQRVQPALLLIRLNQLKIRATIPACKNCRLHNRLLSGILMQLHRFSAGGYRWAKCHGRAGLLYRYVPKRNPASGLLQ